MLITPTVRSKEIIKSGLTNIKIRISHKGDTRYISTKFYILPEQWVDGQVTDKNINADFINLEIKKILIDYESKLIKVNPDRLPIRRIVELLSVREDVSDFTAYFNLFIEEKEGINHRTAEIYQATLNRIKKFDKRNPLMFEDITPGWLLKFEQFMVKEGSRPNTSSIVFRNIRAVINHAINNEVIGLNSYPFRRFKIKSEATESRNLSIAQIKEIRDFQTEWPVLALARDTWMLSLYLIGINNDDLYHATTITGNGRLQYTRAKTHRKYSIKLEPEAKELLTKIKGKKSLLCFSETYDSVHAMTHSVNKALKKILPELTVYHARHSWSTLAINSCKASMDDVAAALGHSKKTVTSIYVNRDPAIVDKLNRQVLDCLK